MNKRIEKYFIGIVIAMALILSYFNSFSKVENLFRDIIYQDGNDIDTRVLIVGIDDKSLEELGRWPFPRERHGELIENIYKGEPAALGVDIIFSEPMQGDKLLIDSLKDKKGIVFPLYGVFPSFTRSEKISPIELKKPLEEIVKNTKLGHINVAPDEDGILRRHMISFDYEGKGIESFSYKLYKFIKRKMKKI